MEIIKFELRVFNASSMHNCSVCALQRIDTITGFGSLSTICTSVHQLKTPFQHFLIEDDQLLFLNLIPPKYCLFLLDQGKFVENLYSTGLTGLGIIKKKKLYL